jgi:hypothetical protein
MALALCAGCGHSISDRERVAVAKCGLPASEKFGLTADQPVLLNGYAVRSLGGGRYRVTGVGNRDAGPGGSAEIGTFICEVAPDPTDKLRGFKVTSLVVKPASAGGSAPGP